MASKLMFHESPLSGCIMFTAGWNLDS